MNQDFYLKGMEYLIEVVQKLSTARTLSDVIAITRHAARELTGADGATFVLRDGDLCYYVDEDAIGPLWKGKRFPMSSCISGWSMLHRKTAVIEDIYVDERIPHEAYRSTFVKSLAMVPIRREKPIGAIGNYWADQYAVPPEKVRLLEALADSTSIALENVQLISDLEAAKSSLEDALRSRDEFLSVAAHELRTPFGTLKLQLQMTERQLKREEQGVRNQSFVDDLAMSLKQVKKLSYLIEQLLEVSQIRLGKLTLEYSRFDFSDELEKAIQGLKPALEEARCPLVIELAHGIEGEWDRSRLLEVVSNLLSNACKYAPGTEVRVTTSRDGDRSAILTIEDRGPGIPKELHRRIFDRFERAMDSSHVSGLGLGLFITRGLVEAHGGHIRLESEVGAGSRFIVELPLTPANRN